MTTTLITQAKGSLVGGLKKVQQAFPALKENTAYFAKNYILAGEFVQLIGKGTFWHVSKVQWLADSIKTWNGVSSLVTFSKNLKSQTFGNYLGIIPTVLIGTVSFFRSVSSSYVPSRLQPYFPQNETVEKLTKLVAVANLATLSAKILGHLECAIQFPKEYSMGDSRKWGMRVELAEGFVDATRLGLDLLDIKAPKIKIALVVAELILTNAFLFYPDSENSGYRGYEEEDTDSNNNNNNNNNIINVKKPTPVGPQSKQDHNNSDK